MSKTAILTSLPSLPPSPASGTPPAPKPPPALLGPQAPPAPRPPKPRRPPIALLRDKLSRATRKIFVMSREVLNDWSQVWFRRQFAHVRRRYRHWPSACSQYDPNVRDGCCPTHYDDRCVMALSTRSPRNVSEACVVCMSFDGVGSVCFGMAAGRTGLAWASSPAPRAHPPDHGAAPRGEQAWAAIVRDAMHAHVVPPH